MRPFPQTFLSLYFQCGDDGSDINRRFGLKRAELCLMPGIPPVLWQARHRGLVRLIYACPFQTA